MNKAFAILIAVIFMGAGAMVAYSVYMGDTEAPEPVTAAQAPEEAPAADAPMLESFELPDMDGVVHASSEWDGKARLINFWATWCAPCRREIPLLKAAQDAYAADNLQVIGIAVDFMDDVRAYADDAQFNYPILVGQEEAMAVAETSGVPFIGLPFTMIVAPSGEMIKTHVGEILEEHIEDIVDVFARLEAGEIDMAGARDALGSF